MREKVLALSMGLVFAVSLCGAGAHAASPQVRVATFNTSLNRSFSGFLAYEMATPGDFRISRIAETIQRVDPDIILLNEFDYDGTTAAIDGFRDNYLAVSHDTQNTGTPSSPVNYPYAFVAGANTGLSSGVDFNGDTTIDDYGFGDHVGQYHMVVLSKHPIDVANARTFQQFLWKDMPGNLIPANYTQAGVDNARLSSKSHWDVPVTIDGQTLHVLASHPTPPVFDDPVFDENGRRNHDEIRFWADYVTPGQGGYIYDDSETAANPGGGLDSDAQFVVLGDLNADPFDGDSYPGAIDQLLNASAVLDPLPTSAGAVEQSILQGGVNASHLGDPALDTADFFDGGSPGNIRADYVLPSANMIQQDAGVFWPLSSDPLFGLVGTFPFPASDHRLVYVDLVVPEPSSLALLGAAGAALLRRRRSQG